MPTVTGGVLHQCLKIAPLPLVSYAPYASDRAVPCRRRIAPEHPWRWRFRRSPVHPGAAVLQETVVERAAGVQAVGAGLCGPHVGGAAGEFLLDDAVAQILLSSVVGTPLMPAARQVA